MDLCETCRGISPQALVDERPHVLPSGIETTQSGYRHLAAYEALTESAKTCPMCALLQRELKGGGLKQGREHSIILMGDIHRSTPYNIAGIVAVVTNSDLRAYLNVFSDPADGASLSGDISGRPVILDPVSEESFAEIRSWLDGCYEGHPECRPTRLDDTYRNTLESIESKFPTRLLYVGDDRSDLAVCRLVDRAAARGEYVALSYCWGTNPPLMTLKDNISVHMEEIKLEDMPLTIREAVVATRRLGAQYLWIDALCIVQDDSSDWEREAPQMGTIYRNAYCTIAAAGSDSSAGGLFHARQPPERVITIQYHSKPSRGQTLTDEPRTMRISPMRSNFLTDVQFSTWNTRGWVLQERNLSRRLVIFGRDQTFFECQRSSVGEDGRNLYYYQSKRFGAGSIPQGVAWEWCLLVEDFTSRRLTDAGDRLFAIDGLARYFAAMTREPYCAGLFVEASPLHLLWYRKDDPAAVAGPLPSDGEGKRRAPSWSWGAVDGPIMWEPAMPDAKTVCKLALPPGVAGLSPGDGRVRGARLSYTGPTIVVNRSARRISEDDGDRDLEGGIVYLIDIQTHPHCYALVGLTGKKLGWAAFDDGNRVPGPFVAAFVSRNNVDNEKRFSVNVLVLKETGSTPNEWARVGVGELTRLEIRSLTQFDERSFHIS